jgi:hypothetical protein
MVSDNHDQTVQEKLKLENSEIMMAANLLLQKTNGHPRTFVNVLRSCQSYRDILNYDGRVDFSNWRQFYSGLHMNKTALLELVEAMKSGEEFDLTQETTNSGGKLVSYDIIANNSFIAWEGSIMKAKLYAYQHVHST